jgi:patatin-like phospholipase/acyl hydrolase
MKESVTEECLESAEVGYFKCLLKQHRYSRINERLSTRNRISSGELWWIYAQAQRHIGDYDGAKFGVQQAMRLESFNMDIQREEKAIRMKQERIQVYEPLDFSSCFSIRSGETPFYNILSIDGGGIRGVIPAIWLMLLEHKIKKPISSIFHVVAGTSTGAIIGAGLTTPSLDSPSKPRYQACDLVELYRTKAEKVFARNSGLLNQLWTSILMEAKYSGDGRHNLFAEYFGGSKLSDALCELVVPAVKGDSNATDVFTRHGSLQDITKNVLLTKMLMCTTAAPTYFPPYSLNDIVYIDGGVQANNPAMLAYDHTLKIYRNCNRNRIRLLSLGTGDYVSDPLNPDSSRNLLFWARNNQSVIKVLMDGPQNNIDIHLNNVLDENYYRWQIWLENPIELDDIREASINRLIDLAHGHLEEMEAYDNRHRLGRLIEELQSSS